MMPKLWQTTFDEETGAKIKVLAPIESRYNRILDLYPETSTAPKILEYRKKLFGHSVIDENTEMYSELSVVADLGISLHDWVNIWDIHDQAKAIARYIISNMVEIIRRHLDLQDQAKKKQESKHKNASKSESNS